MLIGVLRVILNKLNQERFNITFMENIKNLSKKLITLLFSLNMFLKLVPKPMPLG